MTGDQYIGIETIEVPNYDSPFLSPFVADNGTIHMWDWRTGYNFQRIHAAVQPGSLDSESGIFACLFDHSESRLITAEADKTIKVYKEDDSAVSFTVIFQVSVNFSIAAKI